MPLSNVYGSQSLIKAGVCTSTTRPASPFEGQLIYETDTDLTLIYNGSSWRAIARVASSTNGSILRVVSTTKTDSFTTTSSTSTDITGLTASITPSSTSSKVFVIATVVASQDQGVNNGFLSLARGGSKIAIGDSAGSRQQVTAAVDVYNQGYPASYGLSFLDSPSTTSATTYSVQIQNNGSGTVFVNRADLDSDTSFVGRYTSTITVMEVSA